jgi:hypothetical protein
MTLVAAPAIIKPKSHWTPARFAASLESSGRKSGRTVGSHIDDLVQSRRVITLTPEEAKKFAYPRGSSMAERNGYVMRKSMPFARAWCDASGQFHPGCIVFFPRELA